MGKKLVNGEYIEQVTLTDQLPAGVNKIGNVDVASQAGLAYLGEQTISANGASQAATLPADTNSVEIAAEGGDVRYSINGAASANSGGFIPSGQTGIVPKLANLSSLSIFGAAPAKVHLLYFQEP